MYGDADLNDVVKELKALQDVTKGLKDSFTRDVVGAAIYVDIRNILVTINENLLILIKQINSRTFERDTNSTII